MSLRKFGYVAFHENDRRARKGKKVKGHIHHLIPLYLGGDHTLENLLPVKSKLHSELHKLLNEVSFSTETSLAPGSILNSDEVPLTPGFAVIHEDGSIDLHGFEDL